jgi:ribosomal protein S18 acetylase RimI-like enzyme
VARPAPRREDVMPRAIADRSVADAELYRRGAATLLASWEQYARGATAAAVHRFPGVAAAVFPHEPERAVYNNALLERDLTAPERADALTAMQTAYGGADVIRFAAWVHESDAAMRADLQRRGYRLDTSTRAMGMALEDIRLPRPEIALAPGDLFEHLHLAGMPAGFLSGADPMAFHVLVAHQVGENVATALAHDFDDDCGVYNVGTLERARRRGLGTALTALVVHDARARGCRTASLQSTPTAERVYAAVGFRDLGRILEYVPEAADTSVSGVAHGADCLCRCNAPGQPLHHEQDARPRPDRRPARRAAQRR